MGGAKAARTGQRLPAIDDLTRGGHWYLRRTDVCRYLGSYTAGKGAAYSAANSLILDFKMPVSRRRCHPPQKETAIASAAAALRRAARLRASDIEAMYGIDEALAAPEPGGVVVVDDLLTSGAHFRAAQRVLSRRFPDIDVVGLFLARRVPEPFEVRAAPAARAGRRDAGTAEDAASRQPAHRAAGHRGDPGVKIVSIINYKGGVGKTTLTANLAAELGRSSANASSPWTWTPSAA